MVDIVKNVNSMMREHKNKHGDFEPFHWIPKRSGSPIWMFKGASEFARDNDDNRWDAIEHYEDWLRHLKDLASGKPLDQGSRTDVVITKGPKMASKQGKR